MKILLPLDYSRGSVEALESLIPLCDPEPACVHILHVMDGSSHSQSSGREELIAAKQLISASVKKLSTKFPNCQITGEQVVGLPSKMILETAHRIGSDLIVMGFHNSNGLTDCMYGDVVHSVLTHASCGVRIVRPPVNCEPKDSYNILLATNDGQESDFALERVLATNWPCNTVFKLVTVIRADKRHRSEEQSEKLAESWLKCCVVRLRQHLASDMVTSEVLVGEPAERIIQEATDWPADLIILGCRYGAGLDKLLHGSVSNVVANKAQCSVEILPFPSSSVKYVVAGN
jgi:nucleotide-binding universal stress UspA family protein